MTVAGVNGRVGAIAWPTGEDKAAATTAESDGAIETTMDAPRVC